MVIYMGNTAFYKEAQKTESKITWKDIFSESLRKHTREELDRTMAVGTSLYQVNETNMLQTWHKPWLWYPAAKVGLGLIVLLFAGYFGCLLVLGTVAETLLHLMLIIPPVVVPILVMLFFWELNIPQNISLMELFAYFVGGGVLCFIVNSVMFLAVRGEEAYLAPFREEPSKLAASVVILLILERVQHKKIYGLTGLVVGAAVGAGFSSFESISYALSHGVVTEILRIILAIGGHMVFSAPFVAALCLAAHKRGRFSAGCFADTGFLTAFATACAIHFAWNYFSSLRVDLLLIPVMWSVVLYWVRRCLNEAVQAGHYISSGGDHNAQGQARTGVLYLTCIAGTQLGRTWQCDGQPILLGRANDAGIQIPEPAKGVSRHHCSVRSTSGGWAVQDLNSTYGTFLSTGQLGSGQEVLLRDGECIYLGSKQVAFRVTIQ